MLQHQPFCTFIMLFGILNAKNPNVYLFILYIFVEVGVLVELLIEGRKK